MKKEQKIALNILTVFLLHAIFWVCNYYPRHILEFTSWFSIGSTLLNFAYFFLYNYVLVVIFCKNKCLFSRELFASKESYSQNLQLPKLLILMVFQLAIDGILLLLKNCSIRWEYWGMDFLTILYFGSIYFILVDKESVFWNDKKRWNWVWIAIALALGVQVCLDASLIFEFEILAEKYQISAPHLVLRREYLDFIHSIYFLIFDSLVSSILIAAHLRESTVDAEAASSCRRADSLFFLRSFLLIVASFFLIVIKSHIYPYGSLEMTYHVDGFSHENYEVNGEFNITVSNYTINRITGWEDTLTPCYQSCDVLVQKGDIEPVLLTFDQAKPSYALDIQNNTIVPLTWNSPQKYLIGESNVYLYVNLVVCFYENGAPKIVKVEELIDEEKNEILIQLCERLIFEGNVFAFEYGAQYLLEHSPDFIEPYIERYADGNFNNSETVWMEASCYRSEYIVDIAKQLKNLL